MKQIEAEIVSALLTENNLSFSELTALLSEKESGGEASVYRGIKQPIAMNFFIQKY